MILKQIPQRSRQTVDAGIRAFHSARAGEAYGTTFRTGDRIGKEKGENWSFENDKNQPF